MFKKNVLITGGAGFIGSHVCDILVKNNYKVIIVDNLSSGKNSNINDDIKFYNIDINSPELETVFKENKIDYVFHFAAQASVSISEKDPEFDAKENILGSVNMLKFSKKYGVKKFIVSSTAAVYGLPKYLPVNEEHETVCLSFYGLSKLTMEKYIQMFGIDYIIFRFANVYGPRQSSNGEAGVVAIFADKMKHNEEIQIHGNGEQSRDFLYVKDVAQVCLKVIESDVKNEIINVSTNTAISINDLYRLMAKVFDYKLSPIYTEERNGDIKDSRLDNKKCQELLKFKPQTTLEDGISNVFNVL
jgi:UDP-glucose 4-epimerase